MINTKIFCLTTFLATISILSSTSFASLKGDDQLLIQTGSPKKANETAFSTLVSWRKGDTYHNKANGLTFINGSDTKKPTTNIEAAKKIASSLNGGINYEAPKDRGAIATFKKDEADVLISNKASFNLTRVTTRDYSNQKLHYSVPGKSFNQASLDLAIDLVYSAAVEYMENFSSNIPLETAGGSITVTIDNKPAIEIKTDNKSTTQLENELAKAIGTSAHFSSEPMYPNFVEPKSRNYKPFDGGEVQLPLLDAKSITIDINDSGLGVLTKFKFPNINKPEDNSGNLFYIIGLFLALGLAYFFYRKPS